MAKAYREGAFASQEGFQSYIWQDNRKVHPRRKKKNIEQLSNMGDTFHMKNQFNWKIDYSSEYGGDVMRRLQILEFLDSIQARGIMYGSQEYSRNKLDDQTISIALKEFDRYWKCLPGAFERMDWTLKVQVNPFWQESYFQRQRYMLAHAPKLYQPY